MDSEPILPCSSRNPAYPTNAETSETPISLFPAYAENVVKIREDDNTNKDWLCNTSFSHADYKEAVILHEKYEAIKIHANDKKSSDETNKKLIKKIKEVQKKKEDTKYAPPPKYHNVPESDSIWSHLRKKTFIEETGLAFERAFRVDAKYEPENLTFDSFEQKNIAKYKMRHYIPFGVHPDEQNLWTQILPKKKEKKPSRYFSKRALKYLKNNNSEGFSINSKKPTHKGNLDFIPLPLPSNVVNKEKIGEVVDFDGISVDWKLKTCLSSIPEKEIEQQSVLESQNEIQAKTIMFNKKLTESPHNIETWLDFVNFQDELSISQEESNSNNLISEASINEKKLAILDKGLKHNPKSIKLHIAKLSLCQNIFKIDNLISSWDELIFFNPNNPEVWQAYLHFTLTNLVYFNTPRIIKLYSKCLRTLSNLSEGIIETHEPPPNIVLIMIDIFIQLCFVLKSCGYIEQAIASLQALIEFNIFCDQSVMCQSVSEQIACFEPFWDSGAPRIGEDNAIGWVTTVLEKKVHTDKISSESDLNNLEDEILYQKLPEFRTWLEFEKLRETYHWLPWRPNPEYDQTNDDIDDVDRTVPFENISKFLFRIVDEEHKFLLIMHFVKFLSCNLHLFGCKSALDKTGHNEVNVENYQIFSQKLNENIFQKQVSNPLYLKAHSWTTDKFNFVNNIFTQIIEKFSLKHRILLSFMWLKFRRFSEKKMKEDNVNNSVEELKNFGKSMLQKNENRNCLLLWSEYIKIERLTSKARAKKTFEMLLVSSSSATLAGSMDFSLLWYFVRSYCDYCIQLDKQHSDCEIPANEIIWILIQLGCKEKCIPYSSQSIKPALILKATAGFNYFLEKELKSLCFKNNELCYCLDPCSYSALDCAKCFAYLKYFTQGLEAALKIYESTTTFIKSSAGNDYLLEQLCVFQAELLNFHTWRSNSGIKPLQTYLYDSVKKYPTNSHLLLFLVKLRNASCVMGPTRRFFVQILKGNNKHHPITWIFALASELSIFYSINEQKCFESGQFKQFDNISLCWGIDWKIRSLYEKIVQSQSCMYNPILWRSYIKFEMLLGDSERVKGIFHRAMQNCGWSKELLMDGIESFPGDLKQILNFMMEKQIRIHTPLEEVKLLMEHAVQDP